MNNILSKEELQLTKASGKILNSSLAAAVAIIKPGVSTFDIDKVAEDTILSQGAVPSFKNYFVEGAGHYPATICISINHEVVHGIPSKSKIIKEGDLVSLDLGASYKGLFTDMAVTVGVGKISDEAQSLLDTTRECLREAIKEAKTGNTMGDIGHTVQRLAESRGFGVVRDLVGHGIGRKPHLPPQIPNYGSRGEGQRIVEGMALAIEPMITLGDYKIKLDKDGWTITTIDNSLAAHFEHTVVIEDGFPVIVTDICS